ncbi:MAG: deoxyhypusine synthase family protein [Nitrospirae bacterium]|nr:deoxyhypusine synthase family protein [Nitrospirota bacterium]
MDRKKCLLSKEIKHFDATSSSNINHILNSFHNTSFQSRNLARCFSVFKSMLKDKNTVIFFGLSGALVPGGMKKVVRDLIALNMIDVLVSTGANLYHDFFESHGYHHYVAKEHVSDEELREMRIDRIYDTFADDTLFLQMDAVFSDFAGTLQKRPYSSREFLWELGKTVKDPDSIIGTAHRSGVPIFCPTIHDSGIGIGLTAHCFKHNPDSGFIIDVMRDNYEIMQIAKLAKSTAVFYVGGGVPKNYIQQIEPMLEVCGYMEHPGHKFAIQITTDDPKWGGLSGCTFEEAKSWGKISYSATSATVYVDATIGLPLLAAAMAEEKEILKNRAERKFVWEGSELRRIKIVKK